jgi:predicted SnoaL-like aldol condensation-catalyzing enzyme
MVENWRGDKARIWPGLVAEIKRIFGSGDMVASLEVNQGTNKEFGRFATWSTREIYRLEDGKIREIWAVEDTWNQYLQLGYRMQEPEPAGRPR